MDHAHPRILIVKLAAIGDTVMALPMLVALRKKHPQAHITWICGLQIKPLLEATNLVDELISIDEKRLLAGSLFTKVLSLLKLWGKIAGKFFDRVYTLHSDPRYQAIVWPVRCRQHKYFGQSGQRFYPVPGRYHVHEYLQLLGEETGPRAVEHFEYPSLTLPKLHLGDRLKDKRIVILAPGGAKNVLADDALRRWPLSHYVKLAKELLKENVQVILSGSSSDRWVCSSFAFLPVQNFVGKQDLLELIALLQKASLLITHDSGPLHLAKLANCPTIALFGPTNPKEKTSSQENIRVLWGGEHLACRPCYNGKTYAACRKNSCLIDLSPEKVLAEAKRILTSQEGANWVFSRSSKADSYTSSTSIP